MDKETKNNFVFGVLTVVFATIVDSFIPAIMSLGFFNLTLGLLVSGGIGALVAAYVRKAIKI